MCFPRSMTSGLTLTTHQLALLIRPAANGVYRAQLPELARAELTAVHHLLTGTAPISVSLRTEGRAEFLDVELSDEAMSGAFGMALDNLSFVHCVFEVSGEEGTKRPHTPRDMQLLDQFPSDLISIQRYAGKTNEMWTHLGVVLAASAARRLSGGIWNGSAPVKMFDPMAGRGTTINRALMFGWDCAGIELDKTSFDDWATFSKHYLREHRVKHQHNRIRLKPQGERVTVTVSSGAEKAELPRAINIDLVQGKLADARKYFSKNSFDAVFADLPYGVQHTGTSGKSGAPDIEGLVAETLSSITGVVRAGGGVAFSWNTHNLGRNRMQAMLTDAGLEVVEADELGEISFTHIVDRSIRRDIVIARLP